MENLRKTITIVGYYVKNLGDLLMIQGILDNIDSNIKINLLTYGELDKQALNFSGEINIYNAYKTSISEAIKLLKQSSIFMWGGGTCFHDAKGGGAIKFAILARLVGNKVIYFGIGVDRFKKIYTRLCVLIADLISSNIVLRDNASLNNFYFKNKIKIAPDPVLLNYSKIVNNYKETQNSNLLISYRRVDEYFGKENAEKYRDNFIECIKRFILEKQIIRVTIFDTDELCDAIDNEYIYNALSKSVPLIEIKYKRGIDVSEKIKELASHEYIITGRLHVGFIAFFFKKKFLLLNYSRKNEQFLSSYHIENLCVGYNQMDDNRYFCNIEFSNNLDCSLELSHQERMIASELKNLI